MKSKKRFLLIACSLFAALTIVTVSGISAIYALEGTADTTGNAAQNSETPAADSSDNAADTTDGGETPEPKDRFRARYSADDLKRGLTEFHFDFSEMLEGRLPAFITGREFSAEGFEGEYGSRFGIGGFGKAFEGDFTAGFPVINGARQIIGDIIEKWNALPEESKQEVNAIKDEIKALQEKLIDKYAEFGIIDSETAEMMKNCNITMELFTDTAMITDLPAINFNQNIPE